MKRLLTIITIVVIALSANAQFRYAPIAGYSNTTLDFNQNLFTVNSVSGFKAGVMGELMFPGIGFGLDIGALYHLKGAEVYLGQKEVWAADGYGKNRLYLHYLEIPVNLKFKWTRMQGLEDYVAPFVFGGPTIGFMLAHSKVKAFDYSVLEFGLQVGLGFELFKRWQIQACYNWGMTTAVQTKKLDDFTGDNANWSISILRYF